MEVPLTTEQIQEILSIPIKKNDLVGEGCMGKAYKIEYNSVPMVLKIQAYNEEFLNEVWKHQALSTNPKIRPHIPMFYGSYEDATEGKGYILMEYLEGKTLRNIYDSETLSAENCQIVFDTLEHILEIFHEEGYVYYDLAPCNVFIEKDGASIKAVKLIDFGATRFLGNNNNNTHANASANTFKFQYMKEKGSQHCMPSGGKSRKQRKRRSKTKRRYSQY